MYPQAVCLPIASSACICFHVFTAQPKRGLWLRSQSQHCLARLLSPDGHLPSLRLGSGLSCSIFAIAVASSHRSFDFSCSILLSRLRCCA